MSKKNGLWFMVHNGIITMSDCYGVVHTINYKP